MSPASSPDRQRARRQRGVTLIEAIVAMMVMSFGMVALVELMGNLRRSGDLGKQRNEAMRLAQAELALQRSFSVLQKAPGSPVDVRDYEEIQSQEARVITPTDSNAAYTVQLSVTNLGGESEEPRAKAMDVTVTWNDRSTRLNGDQPEAPQAVVLRSIVSRTDPAFAGSVGVAPPAGGTRQPAGRHPVIPNTAKDLGNKTSAYRPSSLGSVVWVFNNVSGVITGKCAIPAGTPVSALTAADTESCTNNTVGYLLSGIIRFSYSDPANPSVPEGSARNLDLAIVGGTYLTPELDRRGNPRKDSTGAVVMTTATATPPSRYECFNDSAVNPGVQSFVNYDCIVYVDTATPRTWSGKLTLTGLSIGTTGTDYRVCRYSADYNANDSVYVTNTWSYDNYEHPNVYVGVTGSLARQNFLVIKGSTTCPTAPAVNPTAGVFVDYSTRQLQPAP